MGEEAVALTTEVTPEVKSGVVPETPELKTEPPRETKSYSQDEVDKIVNKSKKNAAYRARKEIEAYYKGLNEGRQTPQKPVAKDPPPQRENYESYEAYMDDKSAYIAREQARDELTRAQREADHRKQNEDNQKTVQGFQEKLHQKYPDIDDKLNDLGEVVMPQGMGYAIASAETGPDILNYLAENPNEFERIVKLSPSDAIRAIGRLEARFEAPAAKPPITTSKAPEPIKPVAGSVVDLETEPDPNKNGGKDWLKWRERQLRQKK